MLNMKLNKSTYRLESIETGEFRWNLKYINKESLKHCDKYCIMNADSPFLDFLIINSWPIIIHPYLHHFLLFHIILGKPPNIISFYE